MHWLEDNWIGNSLGRGSRIVLGFASAVLGVVMIISAPPTDNAAAFYVIALVCFLICIGNSRVRHFTGSAVGVALFAGSLWYQQKRVFYKVNAWNLLIGVAVITFGFIQIARSTSLWILLVPLLMFIYTSVKRETLRSLSLWNRGYCPGRRLHSYWLYEEVQGFNLTALLLPVENTEPGHWELFIPDDTQWRATVTAWAGDRRREIALRIAEAWKPKDFHLPNDLKNPNAGG
jgi:hypothetical protein